MTTVADLERALEAALDPEGAVWTRPHRDKAMTLARRWGAAKALVVVGELEQQAFMCHSVQRLLGPGDPKPPHTDKCPGCAVKAQRERLEKEVEGA